MADLRTASAGLLPWPRSAVELEAEWRRLNTLAQSLTAGGSRATAELSAEERCFVGIWSAARWTVVRADSTPLTHRPGGPDFLVAFDELTAAEDVIDQGAADWELASGVARWLNWLIGAEESVRYPRLT